MVVLRYLLGNTETVVLIFPKCGGALFSLFFFNGSMGLGGCKVLRATCLLELDEGREGLCYLGPSLWMLQGCCWGFLSLTLLFCRVGRSNHTLSCSRTCLGNSLVSLNQSRFEPDGTKKLPSGGEQAIPVTNREDKTGYRFSCLEEMCLDNVKCTWKLWCSKNIKKNPGNIKWI